MRIRPGTGVAAVFLLIAASLGLRAADSGHSLTTEQKEQFLLTAHIEQVHNAAKGVTGVVRVTLSDGTVTHDAGVQRIDEHKPIFQGENGASEANFKDSYKFNIAGWKLARMLGIDDMTPPTVERKFEGTSGAFSWWVEDVMMDEGDRLKKKAKPPDMDAWNQEVYVVRVFDQLIYNVDRNLQNMIVDKNWHLWMIDHSRAFRLHHTLQLPKNLVQCDRNLLEKLRALNQPDLEREMKGYLTKDEIKGMLFRRDIIVKTFEAKGESALYARPTRT
jgi:hypothetical protein